MPKSGIHRCSHGITDLVDINVSSIRKDFRDGTQSSYYAYFCKEHNQMGIHIIHGRLPVTQKSPPQTPA
jgi:hypothetical protein